MHWSFYAVWRPARRLPRALFVLCSVATSKAFITCTFSMQSLDRPARRYHMYRSFYSVSIDQKGVYHVYVFYAVSRPERVFITCPVGCICRFRTSQVFATCTGCSIHFLDQQGVSHLHWPVTALCCVLRQNSGWRLFTLFDTNKQAKRITHSSPLCLHSS